MNARENALEIIQDFLVPEYHRLFGLCRKRGVLIEFHSYSHIASHAHTLQGVRQSCPSDG